MNLKEQLRVEIRKELNKLEMTCIDMASLLRGLGIQVGGGLYPMTPEVSCLHIHNGTCINRYIETFIHMKIHTTTIKP